jgi:hypothetical protein
MVAIIRDGWRYERKTMAEWNKIHAANVLFM